MKKRNLIATLLGVAGFFTAGLLSLHHVGAPVSPAKPAPPSSTSPKTLSLSANPTATQNPTSKTAKSTQVAATALAPTYPEKATSDMFEVNGHQYPLRKYRALMTPSDPSATQWWTTQTGLPTAWGIASGANTKIAIIDTGFALQHEEFTGRWLDNAGESGPTTQEATSGPNCTSRGLALDKSCNGLDDDGNGYVDDFRGWDFDSDDALPQAGDTNPNGTGVWHGTAVSGIAAATGNNGVGIAGVSWGAKILPLQALNDDGEGDTLTISHAIRYAADRGVDVINLSLGSTQEDSYLRQAIQYALGKGTVVVAAAGNDGCDCIEFPAIYPEVVSVGASNSAGAVASFSDYGDNLDIVAPGQGMKSAGWSKTNGTSAYATNIAGTSFSAPYVSGVLADLKSIQPNATWGQLTNALFDMADHKTLTAASPHSKTFGFGYVRPDSALIRATSNPQPLRYAFSLANLDVLDAATAQECDPWHFPTAPFYQITSGGSTSFSISQLAAAQQSAAGATVTQHGYVCSSLPTDQADMVRLMSPQREFLNLDK